MFQLTKVWGKEKGGNKGCTGDGYQNKGRELHQRTVNCAFGKGAELPVRRHVGLGMCSGGAQSGADQG